MIGHGLVDMHLHSNFSDGLESPMAIANYLSLAGVELAALTDHDTMMGVPEFLYWSFKKEFLAVPGVEVSSLYHGYEVHILGLNVNYSLNGAEDLFKCNKAVHSYYTNAICDYLRKQGYLKATIEEMIEWCCYPGYCISPLHIIEFIARNGEYEYSAIKKIVFDLKIKCEQFRLMSSVDAVRIISNELGGIPILAHPGEVEHQVREAGIDDPREILTSLIADLKMVGLRGIEAFHSRHAKGAEIEYVDIARRSNLGITAGSDYHGPQNRFPEIGQVGIDSSSVYSFLL